MENTDGISLVGGDASSRKMKKSRRCKHAIYNDHFQNFKRYALPKAQLVIAAKRSGRSGYGFEIKKSFHRDAIKWLHQEGSQGSFLDVQDSAIA